MTNLLTNGSFEGPHTTWTAIASGDAAGWFAVTNTPDLNRNLLGQVPQQMGMIGSGLGKMSLWGKP